MDQTMERKLLISDYLAYVELLSSRGITVDVLSEDELAGFDLPSLRRVVIAVKALARTPSGG
jgi:hypothetical protein